MTVTVRILTLNHEGANGNPITYSNTKEYKTFIINIAKFKAKRRKFITRDNKETMMKNQSKNTQIFLTQGTRRKPW